MRVTVLGNASRYLAPLSGGSGYLVETDGGARILLDCGGGTRDALASRGVKRVDAIVLTHFHYDHVLDFPTLGAILDEKSVVVIPPGEQKRLDALSEAFVFRRGGFDFGCSFVEADRPIEVAGQTLSFAPTQHSAPSFATRIGNFVYASDAAPNESLLQHATNADLLLMHTLLPTVEPDSAHAQIHSTAETAAKLGLLANARRLLLSHRYWESSDEEMLKHARGHARVLLAQSGSSYDVHAP